MPRPFLRSLLCSRSLRLLAVLALLSLHVACGDASDDETAAGTSSPVVARFGDRVITAADVDARILALPPRERPKPGEALDEWYVEQVRDLAVDRVLLERARSEDREADEQFQRAARQAEKQVGLQLCLAEITPPAEPLTVDDLRAELEANPDRFSVPERRSLYQIFLRRRPGAEEAIEALRDRVLAGESFLRLAAESSDSETRHREGFIGWMTPGQLPEGFEEVAWSLEEGVPSRPVATREGFHLFYVDQVLPARTLSFDEARPYLQQTVLAKRQEAALARLDEKIDPPDGALVLDREQLAAVVEAGDEDAVVLRLGDETWSLADLRARVAELLSRQERAGQVPTFQLVWQVLDQARRREEIYRSCVERDLVRQDALEESLARWRERTLIEGERHRRLVELAQQDPERLRLFYESNLGEFSTAPTWTLRWLQVPLGDQPTATMARLEAAARSSSASLDSLQSELGGEIQQLEPRTLAELGRMQPKLPRLVAPLRVGQLSAPVHTQRGLEIVQVVERTDAEPIPFDEVRQRVANRYVQQYTAELYERLSREVLGQDELRIDEEAVAELRRTGLPQPDVSVEELEELLAGS